MRDPSIAHKAVHLHLLILIIQNQGNHCLSGALCPVIFPDSVIACSLIFSDCHPDEGERQSSRQSESISSNVSRYLTRPTAA